MKTLSKEEFLAMVERKKNFSGKKMAIARVHRSRKRTKGRRSSTNPDGR